MIIKTNRKQYNLEDQFQLGRNPYKIHLFESILKEPFGERNSKSKGSHTLLILE